MSRWVAEIRRCMDALGRPVKLMEVCGTHTTSMFRHGIRSVIPREIRLLSGPGCPVCVTSIRDVDTAIHLSGREGVILATFGDMMRVPGGSLSLDQARAQGADVRVVYSPLDALNLAVEQPHREVVFFATGFETTSPLIAATVSEARRRRIENFSVFSVHKRVPPALKALLDSPDVQVDGFILPGHVSTIIGAKPYEFVSKDYARPSVITGFEAEEILEGISLLLAQIVRKKAAVEIQYRRMVRAEGNPKALALIDEVFETVDAHWRGIGTIPASGLRLRDAYSEFDAASKFSPEVPDISEPKNCLCGHVLRGVKIPTDCPLFGKACRPEKPVGACMVSTEGSCAAYYKYGGGNG